MSGNELEFFQRICRAYVLAAGSPMREGLQALAVRDDCIGITLRDLWRSCGGDVERRKLFLRFWRENDAVLLHAFALALLCSAVSAARTWSTEIALAGSAFGAS